MDYKHLILTRFNLQFDPQSNIHIQPNWLNERFRLFEAYCLPSIIRQTNQRFDWVIFLSDQTPEIYQQYLKQLTQAYSNIHIELCPYLENFNHFYKNIGEKYLGNHNFLLSTRIDSDDMLANNYVEILQSQISIATPCPSIISFPHGIQWFEHKNIAFAVEYNNNHYLSFWEEKAAIRTSLGADHTLIKPAELLILKQPCMWCEIVHNSNICNSYVPKYRYSLTYSTENFPIHVEAKKTQQCRFLVSEHIKFRYHQWMRLLNKLV